MANTIPLLISYLKADTASENSRQDSFVRTALLFANLDSLLNKASVHISVWRDDFESDMETFLQAMYKSLSDVKLTLETPKLVNKMYWTFVRNQFLGDKNQKSVLESMYEVAQFSEKLPDNSIPVVVTGKVDPLNLGHKLLIVTNKRAVCQGNPAFLFLVSHPVIKLEGKIRVNEEADESNHLIATFHGSYGSLVDFISRNLLNYAAENYLKAIFIGEFSQESVQPLFDASQNSYYATGEEKTMFEDGFPVSLRINVLKPELSETEDDKFVKFVEDETSRNETSETSNAPGENISCQTRTSENQEPERQTLGVNSNFGTWFGDESEKSEGLERKEFNPNIGLRRWHRLAIGALSENEATCISEDIVYMGVSSPFDLLRLFNQKRNHTNFFSSQKASVVLSPSLR